MVFLCSSDVQTQYVQCLHVHMHMHNTQKHTNQMRNTHNTMHNCATLACSPLTHKHTATMFLHEMYFTVTNLLLVQNCLWAQTHPLMEAAGMLCGAVIFQRGRQLHACTFGAYITSFGFHGTFA
eukprot:GGOE01055955.1.p1 GENE.GGOE01055955.1~~GGOE01055955.1.p1  ORF type:complete len:124 (+),score=3.95 GGOE01055955.1:55-426(+)